MEKNLTSAPTPEKSVENRDPRNLRERIAQRLPGFPGSRPVDDLDEVYLFIDTLESSDDQELCLRLLPGFAGCPLPIVDRLRELFEWVRYGTVTR